MIYRLNNNAPDLEWLVSTNIPNFAIVTATYTKPNGDVVASICALQTSLDAKGNPQTRITHSWNEGDLNVLGIGKIQLTWATDDESGYIAPATGWNITVIP